MAQHFFAAETALSQVQLDANFSDLYGVAANMSFSAGKLTLNPTAGVDIEALSIINTQTAAVAKTSIRMGYTTVGWGTRIASFGNPSSVTTNSLSFETGNGTGYDEMARFDGATKYLLVGYTASNGAYKLQVNSQIFATSSTVATSDARYKEGVEGINGALDLVNELRPVTFTWKEHPVHAFPSGRHAGFLAQDVARALVGSGLEDTIVKRNSTVMPDGTEQEFLGIAEGNLIPILTRAIQELAARVSALEAR